MGKNHLGELEELVMLTVALLREKAYGFGIIEELETRMNRSVCIAPMLTDRFMRVSSVRLWDHRRA